MENNFITCIAKTRAEKIFNKNFFITCTDSWYDDEKAFFEENIKAIDCIDNELMDKYIDTYMNALCYYKNIYQDKYFSKENALCSYNIIINNLRDAINTINESYKYKEFVCDTEIIKKIKEIGNYFVKLNNDKLISN